MIHWMKRLHIYRARQRAGLRNQRGQIATLMLLVIIIVLMFALMTANLGSVALASNTVTNAADASVLLLASQLASRSNQLWETLDGETERCVSTGMLGPVMSLVFALFVILVPIGGATIAAATADAIGAAGGTAAAAATTIGVGAVAGATGGAIGAGIAGTDPGVGAMQGAIAGAAVGSGAVLGAELGAGSTTSSTSTVPAVGEAGSDLIGPPAPLAPGAKIIPEVVTPVVDTPLAPLVPVESAVPVSTPPVVGGTTAPAAPNAASGTPGADLTKVIKPPPPPPPEMPPPPPPMSGATMNVGTTPNGMPTVSFSPPPGASVAQLGTHNAAAAQGMQTFANVLKTTGGNVSTASFAAAHAYNVVAATGFSAAQVGAAVGGTLISASNLYSNSVKQSATADALSAAAKSITGLPARQGIAYSVIFDALSRIVDDPTRVTDDHDADGDGDHTDQIPNFLYQWDRRTAGLLQVAAQLSETVAQFVAGPLKTMREQAQDAYSPSGPGVLARQAIEGAQGALEKLTSDLWDARGGQYQAELRPFWELGPNRAEYERWRNAPRPATCTEESCSTPSGWDEVDATIEHLKGFVDSAKPVQDAFVQDPRALTNNWDGWVSLFYDPNPDPNHRDYVRIFGIVVDGDEESFEGMRGWMRRLERIKSSLPQCIFDLPGVVSNAPCRESNTGRATSDAMMATDEFAIADAQLSVLASQLNAFRAAAQEFVNKMNGTTDAMTKDTLLDLYGLAANYLSFLPYVENYKWNDSRGDHDVTVMVGPFEVPKLEVEERGGPLTGETCIVMKEYRTTTSLDILGIADDSAPVPVVLIIRKDPAQKPLGLWTWNNYDGQIVKFSSAHYSFDSVGLSPLNAIQPLVREFLQMAGLSQ